MKTATKALLVGVALLAGCLRVLPHRREVLARPDMTLGEHPALVGGEEHAQAYREGSSGGARVKAGGCGCN